MAKIPPKIRDLALMTSLMKFLIHQGKVRDSYIISKLLLLVASDRISIFDFVLAAIVPKKGEVLTALTHFWLTSVLKNFPNHLVSLGDDPHKNYVLKLREAYPDIDPRRCLVARQAEIPEWEMIYRAHIGGSIYNKYLETGKAGGQSLPLGLPKWSRLTRPIFTPSTKAKEGHDINKDAEDYFAAMGERGKRANEMFLSAYTLAYAHAKARGILILDTKFEGLDVIADEVITPDSSRFTTVEDWKKAMAEGRDPVFFDKQPVRDWGATVVTPFFYKKDKKGHKKGERVIGLNNLDPKDEEHIAFVHGLEVPEDIILLTTERYLMIFKMLTGMSLEDYQERYLL